MEFKSRLLQHQREQLRFHLQHPHSANWSEMGTGKTVVALKFATVLSNAGLLESTLVVCPLSVLRTWEIEVEKHTSFRIQPLIGDLQTKLNLLQKPADIYAISYDSIPGRRTKTCDTYGIMMGALLQKQFNLVICDEATTVKGYGTLRTQAITLLCDNTPFTLFLSGTPISNNPADIFNIYRALDGGKTFGKNFYAARNKYFENIGYAFPKWELRDDRKEELQRRMYSIACRVKKDDCLDLPPKIFSPRFCYMTDEQRRFYLPIVQDLLKVLELEEGTVKIKNAMTKLAKLSQLTSGFLYTDDETMRLQDNPKLRLLDEVLEENRNEKVIIYCYWQEDVKIISEFLRNKGWSVGTLFGETPPIERGKLVDDFQKGGLQYLVANIGVGGYGLTLTASSTIVYYNLSFKVIDFLQSQDRIHRHGQARTCLYLPLLTRGTIDEYIYQNVVKNTAVAESIVDGTELKESLRRFLNETN